MLVLATPTGTSLQGTPAALGIPPCTLGNSYPSSLLAAYLNIRFSRMLTVSWFNITSKSTL